MPSARGLNLAEALRLTAHISANEDNRAAFQASPRQVMQSLGIDADAAMAGCDVDTALTLPSLQQLREAHDELTGKFLTAHASNTIHHVSR